MRLKRYLKKKVPKKAAEEAELVPVDVDMLLTIRIVNPYRALFRIQNWLEATQNQVIPAFRAFIAKRSFVSLIGKKETLERLSDEFLEEYKLDSYLEKTYGVRLKRVGMLSVNPGGERGLAYREATTKLYEAEKEAKRLETVITVIEKHGDTGRLVRFVEGIEKAGEQGQMILPVAGVLEHVRGLFGPRPLKEG